MQPALFAQTTQFQQPSTTLFNLRKTGSEELRREAAVARVLGLRLPLEVGDVTDAATVRHTLEVLLR